MNDQDVMDRLLRSWFAEDAVRTPPANLLDAIADSARRRRQQPRWLARLPGAGAGASAGAGAIPGRVLVFAVLVAGLGAAALGSATLTGGSTTPAIPASLTIPPPTCSVEGRLAPMSGTLPMVGRRDSSRPRNGLLAVTDFVTGDVNILSPVSGERLATWAGAGTSPDGWSPDGRWLWLRAPAFQSDCADMFIVRSDGSRVLPVSQGRPGEAAWGASWSPDGHWLAIASYFFDSTDFTGRVIDVVRIGGDDAVLDRRRVWSSDGSAPVDGAGGSSMPADVAWGPDGTLAWVADGGVDLLRPDELEPLHIAIDDVLFPMRWSADGQSIVVPGGGGLRVISADEATSHVLDLPVRALNGVHVSEDTVAVSSEGRIYFPGRSDAANGIFSVALDGTGVRDVSAFPPTSAGTLATGPVLSPDESLVAFRRGDEPGGLWIVGTDGTGLHSLPTTAGSISWQPIP